MMKGNVGFKGIQKPLVRCDQLAALAFGESYIKAIVSSNAGGRGDGIRPRQERDVGLQIRSIAHYREEPLRTHRWPYYATSL